MQEEADMLAAIFGAESVQLPTPFQMHVHVPPTDGASAFALTVTSTSQ
jgi:hypothetical protein